MKNYIINLLVVFSLLIGSCTDKKNDSENLNVAKTNKSSIIKANEELFNKGNLDYADEVFTKEYANKGPAMIKEYVDNLRTAFPDIQVSIEPMIAEGNMVAWQRTHTGTHQGEYMGFKPTATKITWKSMVFSEYNQEGKVVKEWSVSDLYEVLQKNKKEEIQEE